MDASKSVEIFHRRVGFTGVKLPVKELFAAVMSFYIDCPVDGLVEKRGDGLLFEFGVYDWGAGLHFEVGLTRQFIEIERDDDDNVFSQFHLTCFYSPSDALISIGSGERWCWSKADLPAFSEWLLTHPVLAAVERLPPLKSETWWELV